MAVYVDDAMWSFKNMITCHLMADNIEELNEMADKIGLKRKWLQVKSSPHYDISKSKRDLAIRNGAIEINRREVVKLIKEYRANLRRRNDCIL